jgi:hypothetical protein
LKKILLILALLIVTAVVIFLFLEQDERQIRRNISSLSTAISMLLKEDGIAALAEAHRIGTFFTEDCQIVVGGPVPEIHGREALISAAYATRMGIGGIVVEVAFRDISVTVAEDEVTAVSIKTAVATTATGREIRNIQMHWEKTDRRWKIAAARYVPILY